MLGQLDEPLFILDLKKMREEDSSCLQWLGNLEFREVGATPEIFYNTQISDMFDYLIFHPQYLGIAHDTIIQKRNPKIFKE